MFFRGNDISIRWRSMENEKRLEKWTCIFVRGFGFDFGLASFCIIFNCYNMYGEKDLASRECM